MYSKFTAPTREYSWPISSSLLNFKYRSKTQLLTLYFLDSGAYSKSVFDIFGFKQGIEYDWIHQVSPYWY